MDIIAKNINDIPYYQGEHAIPGIRFRAARQIMGISAWGMNVLELDPGCEGYPRHDHQADGQEELYVVLEGEVILQVGSEEQTFHKGDMIRVGPSVERKFVTREKGVTMLAVGGTPGRAYAADPRIG